MLADKAPRRHQLLLLPAVVLLLVAAVAPAAARSWRIANFHTTINVEEDGSAVIFERITLVFVGQFRGIHRTIPIDYPGPRGSNYTLLLKVLGVKDGEGKPLKHESKISKGSRDITVYIPGAVDATRTVEIAYLVKNGIRFFSDHDELYWNVTGNDWPVPIDHASAMVMLPPAAAGQLRAQAFTGAYGSTAREASAGVEGASARFETFNPLPMRGGLTIDVFIPKGILREPSDFTRALWFLQSNPIVLLPLVTFAIVFLAWYYIGRDPDPGISVAPMYEPPDGLTPAEVGTLVDDTVHPRDITSTVVDLAVKGYLRIEQVEEKGFIFTSKDYLFHLLKPRETWKSLADHERLLLEKIYAGGGEVTRLSSLKNTFYTVIPTIKSGIVSALKAKKIYRVDPETAAGYFVALAVGGIAVPLLLAHLLTGLPLFATVPYTVISIAISALLVFLFGRKMSAKTHRGARTYTHILGFQEFINRVEADRLQRMPPDTFEKFLPYAMALGIEDRWASAFANIAHEPPRWYQGSHGYMFNPIGFTRDLSYMSSQAHSVFVSAPRSSSTGSGWSGGGFSGGGFSGGGFGGGGGSAF